MELKGEATLLAVEWIVPKVRKAMQVEMAESLRSIQKSVFFEIFSGSWTEEEEQRFVFLILSMGRKWSKIARELESNRTEHMVKNRYKTILGRLKKDNPSIKD